MVPSRILIDNPTFGAAFIAWEDDQPVGYLVCLDYSREFKGRGAWVDELFVQDNPPRAGNWHAIA
jgi:hypothetical protein